MLLAPQQRHDRRAKLPAVEVGQTEEGGLKQLEESTPKRHDGLPRKRGTLDEYGALRRGLQWQPVLGNDPGDRLQEVLHEQRELTLAQLAVVHGVGEQQRSYHLLWVFGRTRQNVVRPRAGRWRAGR